MKTPLDVGDHVRVLGTFTSDNNFTLMIEDIFDPENINLAEFIIIEPTILIASTMILSSNLCIR